MPIVRVRGIDLHYEEYGDGPPLLFAHGLMGSIALISRFGEDLPAIAAKGVRVIAYDARGHGQSGYTTARRDYTWSSQAEDMAGLIEALGLGRVAVYGGSMGAGTAIVCALEHPQLVDRLILRSPPGFGRDARYARGIFGSLALMFQVLGIGLTTRIVMQLPATRRAQEAAPENDLRSFYLSQRREAVVPAIRGLLFDERLPLHRLDHIEQPALILTHPSDPIHPLSSGELLHARMPHARLAVAPDAFYWQQNPDALPHVVAAFVKGEPVARGLPSKARHEHAGDGATASAG